MQTDNGDVGKTGTAFHHALVGFVELAAQVTKARGAMLWITGDGSAGIAASTGLDMDQPDERFEALARTLGELDGRLSGAASGDQMTGCEVAGQGRFWPPCR